MEIKFNNVYFSYNKNTPIENEVLKNIKIIKKKVKEYNGGGSSFKL